MDFELDFELNILYSLSVILDSLSVFHPLLQLIIYRFIKVQFFKSKSYYPMLLSPGFYPEISGFFKSVGIFWDFNLKSSISGFLRFLRTASSKFSNQVFGEIS